MEKIDANEFVKVEKNDDGIFRITITCSDRCIVKRNGQELHPNPPARSTNENKTHRRVFRIEREKKRKPIIRFHDGNDKN